MFERKLLTVLAAIIFVASIMTSFRAAEEAMAADPVDLTGTWDGKLQCKGYDEGAKLSSTSTGNLLITQDSTDLNLNFLGVIYNGAAQVDNKAATKKSHGTIIACGSMSDYSANIDMASFVASINVKDDSKSSFKANSFNLVDDGTFLTCTWTFLRTSQADPVVGACPP